MGCLPKMARQSNLGQQASSSERPWTQRVEIYRPRRAAEGPARALAVQPKTDIAPI